MKRRADIVEVGHAGDVDPGARHRHHDVREADAQRLQQRDFGIGVGNGFADEVLTRNSEMDFTGSQCGGDLGRRHQLHIDAGFARNGGAVIARAGHLLQHETRIAQILRHLFLETPLGGNCEDQDRSRHVTALR